MDPIKLTLSDLDRNNICNNTVVLMKLKNGNAPSAGSFLQPKNI